VWTRLIGGGSADAAFSIKISASGSVFVAGGSASASLAGMNGLHTTKPGGIDGWISELSSFNGQIINGTYVGTSEYDQVYFIDLAKNGDVLAYGLTRGPYPVSPAGNVYANKDGGQFVHRFTPKLDGTVFSTTLGKGNNQPDISPTAFLVNSCEYVFVAGWGGAVNATNRFGVQRNYFGGNTFNLPTTPDAFQKTSVAGNDFYFAVLNSDASELVYASFLGGTSSSTHVDGGTSRFDKSGIVYHAVCASCGGQADDFPSFNVPATRSQNQSPNCNNAAFKFDLATLSAKLTTTAPVTSNIARVCLPEGITFNNESIGGERFDWDFGNGETLSLATKGNLFYRYKQPGRYNVVLTSIDSTTCRGRATSSLIVDVFQSNLQVGPDQELCFGSSTHLVASGASVYSWTTADNSFTSTEASPMIAPERTNTYHIEATDANGCTLSEDVKIRVVPGIDLKLELESVNDCQSRPDVKVKNLSELKAGERATLFFGDGNSTEEREVTHTYASDGAYLVSIQAAKEFCMYQVSEEVRITTLTIPNAITPGTEDQKNDVFRILYGDPPRPREGVEIGLKIMDRWGVVVFETRNYEDNWDGGDVSAGVYYYEVDIPGEALCKGWIHLFK
jgi:PKD repeat protein